MPEEIDPSKKRKPIHCVTEPRLGLVDGVWDEKAFAKGQKEPSQVIASSRHRTHTKCHRSNSLAGEFTASSFVAWFNDQVKLFTPPLSLLLQS